MIHALQNSYIKHTLMLEILKSTGHTTVIIVFCVQKQPGFHTRSQISSDISQNDQTSVGIHSVALYCGSDNCQIKLTNRTACTDQLQKCSENVIMSYFMLCV